MVTNTKNIPSDNKLGRFCVREKKERKGRNPATGDDLMLRPRRVVTFRCSGKLRDRINGKQEGVLKPKNKIGVICVI